MGSKSQASTRRGTSLPAAAALGLLNGLLEWQAERRGVTTATHLPDPVL